MKSFVNFSESPFAQLFNKRCPYWRYFANLKDLYIVDCPNKHSTTEASYTTTLLFILWLPLIFFTGERKKWALLEVSKGYSA